MINTKCRHEKATLMKKTIFTVSLLTLFFGAAKAQTYKRLLTEDFGKPSDGSLPVFGNINTAPATQIAPGISDYAVKTVNALSDGQYAVVTNPDLVDDYGGAYNDRWMNAGDHTDGTGYMMLINANPARQGETVGTYYLFSTNTLDVPGATYRIGFWGANVLGTAPLQNAKNGLVGLAIRDGNGTGTSYSANTWSLPRNTSGDRTGVMPWQNLTSNFTLPLTYKSAALYFNFYNSDTNSSPEGNDLALDDIVIEMQVVSLSGRIFNDANANGVVEAGENGISGVGNTLFVYLTDNTGKVIAKAPVDANGNYSLTGEVPFATGNIGLKTIVSSANLVLGTIAPTAASYPDTYTPASETTNGAPGAVAGTANGQMTFESTAVDMTNLNFGLNRTPVADDKTFSNLPKSTFSATPPAGFGSVVGYVSTGLNNPVLAPLSGSDSEDCVICSTGSTFIVESVKTSNTKLFYDFGGSIGVQEVVPGTSTATITNFDPSRMVIYGAVGSGESNDPLEFKYQLVDAAGVASVPATYSLSTSSSLPVTLTSFTAKKGEGLTTRLDWSTVSEANSKRFEVQRSTDAKAWNTIAAVDAKGESSQLALYFFVDTAPAPGENLYRLKMIDQDGTFTYSRIESERFAFASLYPNPTAEKIKISGVADADVAKVSLLSLDCKVVYTTSKLVQGEIDVKNIANGTYIVAIRLKNGTTRNSKIVIVK